MDISEVKCYNQLKWNIILIQKVEILKMASRMAVSWASKTYMTDVLDKNNLNLTFYGSNDQIRTWFRFRRLKF